jgi:hypothetical protein
VYELQTTQPPARRRLPNYEQLRTIKTALEVFVLALAVPWLVHELFRNPGGLTKRIAGHHMGGH